MINVGEGHWEVVADIMQGNAIRCRINSSEVKLSHLASTFSPYRQNRHTFTVHKIVERTIKLK